MISRPDARDLDALFLQVSQDQTALVDMHLALVLVLATLAAAAFLEIGYKYLAKSSY